MFQKKGFFDFNTLIISKCEEKDLTISLYNYSVTVKQSYHPETKNKHEGGRGGGRGGVL